MSNLRNRLAGNNDSHNVKFKQDDKVIWLGDGREGKIYGESYIPGSYGVVWLLDNGEYGEFISTIREDELELKGEKTGNSINKLADSNDVKFEVGGAMVSNTGKWTYYILYIYTNSNVATLVDFETKSISADTPLLDMIDEGYTYYPPEKVEFKFNVIK